MLARSPHHARRVRARTRKTRCQAGAGKAELAVPEGTESQLDEKLLAWRSGQTAHRKTNCSERTNRIDTVIPTKPPVRITTPCQNRARIAKGTLRRAAHRAHPCILRALWLQIQIATGGSGRITLPGIDRIVIGMAERGASRRGAGDQRENDYSLRERRQNRDAQTAASGQEARKRLQSAGSRTAGRTSCQPRQKPRAIHPSRRVTASPASTRSGLHSLMFCRKSCAGMPLRLRLSSTPLSQHRAK